MEIRQKAACVMFSGGVDSTLAAALLLEQLDEVFLITFDYGAELFIKNCEKMLNTLRRIYGEKRIHHEYLDIERWWINMQLRNAKDFNLVCMSCKFTMHTRAICYCIENGLMLSSDGSVHEQSQHPEQMGQVLKRIKSYYGKYYIDFTTPAYTYSKAAEDKKLESLGIKMGKRFAIGDKKGSHIHKQPLCLFAFFDVLFSDNPFFPHKEEKVIEMLERNMDEGYRLIESFFHNKRFNLEEYLKERKSLWMLQND